MDCNDKRVAVDKNEDGVNVASDSFVEFIVMLKKYRRVLFSTFLVVVLLALFVAIIVPEKYQMRSVFTVGSYMLSGEVVPLQQPRLTGLVLEDSFLPKITEEYVSGYGFVPDVSIKHLPESSIIILQSAVSEKNKELYSGIHKRLLDEIVLEHKKILDRLVSGYRARLKDVDAALNRISNGPGVDKSALLMSQLLLERNDLLESIDSAAPTRVVVKPNTMREPVVSGRLIFVIGVVLGLIVAPLSVLVYDAYLRSKSRMKN